MFLWHRKRIKGCLLRRLGKTRAAIRLVDSGNLSHSLCIKHDFLSFSKLTLFFVLFNNCPARRVDHITTHHKSIEDNEVVCAAVAGSCCLRADQDLRAVEASGESPREAHTVMSWRFIIHLSWRSKLDIRSRTHWKCFCPKSANRSLKR